MSGFAEVQMLDDDGTVRTNSLGEPFVKEIRARDIAMRWDEYEDEREHREAERERLQREHEEQQAREAAEKAAFIDALVEHYSIPRDAIASVDGYTIRLNRRAIEQELANSEQKVE
jgi:hypothetical protein